MYDTKCRKNNNQNICQKDCVSHWNGRGNGGVVVWWFLGEKGEKTGMVCDRGSNVDGVGSE